MKINTFLKLSILLLFLLLFSVFAINNGKIRSLPENYLPYKIKTIIKILTKDKNYTKRFYNDYNVKFLPQTQFESLDFQKKELNFLNKSEENYFQNDRRKSIDFETFFIEILNYEEILITDSKGNFYVIKDYEDSKDINLKNIKEIKSNLKINKILDTFFYKGNLFISYIKLEDSCKTFNISYANFNTNKLVFKSFFENNKCKLMIQAGRMQYLKHKDKDGLIFSIANVLSDRPNNNPQDEKSFFGKMIFKSFDETIKLIYSKGHRNPQGLFVDGDLILSTEHGPRGGDEINKIKFNKNYGWPIASYGQKYKKTNEKNPYMMSHVEQGFEEPIYVFIPSIGISEIIKIPNDFLDSWKDNFIVTSLYKGSIYRIKFDDKYNKLLFAEEIFIGQRVRDVKYHNKKIFLALESQGDLGILNKANKN